MIKYFLCLAVVHHVHVFFSFLLNGVNKSRVQGDNIVMIFTSMIKNDVTLPK